MSIGLPFLYNAPAKVSSNWFAFNERPVATMIGTTTNVAGVGLGFLVPLWFIGSYTRGERDESGLTGLTSYEKEQYMG